MSAKKISEPTDATICVVAIVASSMPTNCILERGIDNHEGNKTHITPTAKIADIEIKTGNVFPIDGLR